MFKLVIQDDEGKTTVVPLIRDEITIGRKEGNTIRLTERNVSRRHARILRNNGEVHIEDLGSYNGIRVNNARIAERVSLRVSDQVQIGDYKLYLKAEGVEQVDDARTMPIERVDTNGGPTEVIPAITAPSPTAPVPIQAPPVTTPISTPPAAPQLVGNPARTLVAISGDDASGRPVATAAAVAALTSTTGHGKLVVLSSNFAGKEFDLSRLQMIIGRTDENDIVINHRSISRNHAKVVREPDSGRYTISDLQSSNGVRVNGQDYGKVELRRGDVVDLGHVRLRFIEPGEDFVFARDAVITDVPESGSKRGLLVAVILGVVVLGAAGAFLVFHNGGDHDQPVAALDAGLGSQTHVVAPDLDAHAGNDLSPPDASQVAVVTPPDAASVVKPADDIGRVTLDCQTFAGSKQWDKEIGCANDKLKSLDAAAAQKLVDGASAEKAAQGQLDKEQKAITAKNLASARAFLDQIGANSVYNHEAAEAYEKAKAKEIENARGDVNGMAKKHQCAEMKTYLEALEKRQGVDVAGPLRSTACTAAVVVVDPGDHTAPDHHQPGPGSGAGLGSAAVVPPPVACDAEEHKKNGDAATGKGNHAQALGEFEAALKCKPNDSRVIALAYMEACASNQAAKARAYYVRMPLTGSFSQATLLQMCVRVNIDPRPAGAK